MVSLEQLENGQIIGRYRLVDLRGQGTNAEVWRADTFDSIPTVSHAAKIFFGDDDTIASATSEATRLNEISSKHVVQLVDFREFFVIDDESWNALGRPVTPDQLRTALKPWAGSNKTEEPTESGSSETKAKILAAYADLAFAGRADIPDPIVVRRFDDIRIRSAQPSLELPLRGAALIQTLCRPESLQTYWEEQGKSLSEQEAVEIGTQIAEALNAIHSAPGKRPHLDVKLDNVFQLDEERSWLVGDLGLGTERSRMASGERAPWFLALPDLRAHRASDIWLLGLMLHQLATGLLPMMFSGIPLQVIPPSFHLAARELARLRVTNDLRSQSGIWIHPLLSAEFGTLIESCLHDDPRARPQAAEVRDLLRALSSTNPEPISVGPHLHSDKNATIAASDAAWILGYADNEELKAAGLTVVNDRVPVANFLAARPAEEQQLSPAELAAQEFAEEAEIRSYQPFKQPIRRPDQQHSANHVALNESALQVSDQPEPKVVGSTLFTGGIDSSSPVDKSALLDQPPNGRNGTRPQPHAERSQPIGDRKTIGAALFAVLALLGVAAVAWTQLPRSDTTSDGAQADPTSTTVSAPSADATSSDVASSTTERSAVDATGDLGAQLLQPSPSEFSTGAADTLLTSSDALNVAAAEGQATFECEPLAVRLGDPIQAGLSPQIDSGSDRHMIVFFGNSQAAQADSNEALISAGSSTCAGGTANRSLYWVPALFDPESQTALEPSNVDVLYQTGRMDPESIQPLPSGFSMIVGRLNAVDQPSSSETVKWKCFSDEFDVSGEEFRGIPMCPTGGRLRQIVRFPQCWNGQDLTSSTGQSHIVSRLDENLCPDGFDTRLPALRLFVDYELGSYNTTQLRLASDLYVPADGRPAGFSAYGGYIHGWTNDTSDRFVAGCLTTPRSCQLNELGDGEALITPGR